MVTHSSTLAWRIPWTEEPRRLQSVGSPRVYRTERLHFLPFLTACHGQERRAQVLSAHRPVTSDSVTPADCDPPGSSAHRMSQARIPRRVVKLSPGESPSPHTQPSDSSPPEPPAKQSPDLGEPEAWSRGRADEAPRTAPQHRGPRVQAAHGPTLSTPLPG